MRHASSLFSSFIWAQLSKLLHNSLRDKEKIVHEYNDTATRKTLPGFLGIDADLRTAVLADQLADELH
jgi:hypothetical protein